MGSSDNSEFYYVAGIGLLLNIFLFATTLLIHLCKPPIENTDIEALDHLQYRFENDHNLNVALLHEHDTDSNKNQQETKGVRLIDLIPAMKFIEVAKDRVSNRGSGCSICLKEGYEDDEMCKVLPGCCHVFHSDCIDELVQEKAELPCL
ncbi:RING-H2 finger protein ATL1-like [Chenopodium quinoa]|uniref:RING-H2 finger protein ATL1-like n=1 Tax=Chenopodium quinoa TaxID=63459 RepID=UPI000B770727|nr:RING-H2 finger protein ATL1-like [Chenopodium quinoa]